jgi:hypothetical protein
VDSWGARLLRQRLVFCPTHAEQSAGFSGGFRIFEGKCLEKFDKVAELIFCEVTGATVLVIGVIGGEHIHECGSAAVVQVGGGTIKAEQGWGIVFGAHEFCFVVAAGADVMKFQLVIGEWL